MNAAQTKTNATQNEVLSSLSFVIFVTIIMIKKFFFVDRRAVLGWLGEPKKQVSNL